MTLNKHKLTYYVSVSVIKKASHFLFDLIMTQRIEIFQRLLVFLTTWAKAGESVEGTLTDGFIIVFSREYLIYHFPISINGIHVTAVM